MTKRKKLVPVFVIPPLPTETVRGYAIRACMENGWPSLRHFLGRIGLRQSQLQLHLQQDVNAACLGLAPDQFSVLAGTWDKRQVDIDGNRFALTNTSKVDRRVCRHCLASSAVAQFEWELDFISDCPEHGPLTKSCDCGQPLTWGDRHLALCDVCPVPTDFPVPRKAGKPRVLPLQHYALGRLGRHAPSSSPILDDLPVEACIEVCRAFGELTERGFAPLAHRPAQEADLISWGELGFAWLHRADEPDDLVDVVRGFVKAGGLPAPREPITALGFIAGLSALHLAGAGPLNALIMRRLAKAAGYPISDLWHTDYRHADHCLAATGLAIDALIGILHDNRWLSSCHQAGDDLFIPVDVLWRLTRVVRAVRPM